MSNEKLVVALERHLRSINKEARNLGIDGWHPIDFRNGTMCIGLWDIINQGEAAGIIHPGQEVLEYGSGSGSSSITWASRGYSVIGVELFRKLVEMSRMVVESSRNFFEHGANVGILQGSYFPRSYIDRREQGNSVALELEEEVKASRRSVLHRIACRWRDEKFYPICDEDVYKKHGVDLQRFDIFYAYAQLLHTPSIMEMFQLYARDDAVLCMPYVQEEVGRRIGLERIVPNLVFYRKAQRQAKGA